MRLKMTMSSAKATVLARVAECGVKVDKNIEVRDQEDFAAAVEEEVRLHSRQAAGVSAGAGAGVAAVEGNVLQFSAKPTRPGKGRAKVSKFVSDMV